MYFFPVIGEKKGDSFALSRTPTEKKKKTRQKKDKQWLLLKKLTDSQGKEKEEK